MEQDGYMDFDVVNGTRCFVLTAKDDNEIYYYIHELQRMFGQVLLFDGAFTLLFALATAIVLFYLLKGYNDAVYARWATVCMPAEMLRGTLKHRKKTREESEGVPKTDDAGKQKPGRIRTLIEKLAAAVHWDSRLPEDKANLVFKVSILILLLSWTGLLLSKNVIYNK